MSTKHTPTVRDFGIANDFHLEICTARIAELEAMLREVTDELAAYECTREMQDLIDRARATIAMGIALERAK